MIFVFALLRGGQFYTQLINNYGMRTTDILAGRHLETLLTSVFLHAGFLHVFGNMIYLYIFGDNIEDVLGHGKFLLFYLSCSLAASGLFIYMDPTSSMPAIGASGAVAGVLGAYLVLYPTSSVLTAVPVWFYATIVRIPAVLFLGLWFVLQFLSGALTLVEPSTSSVAFWAHVGGFIAGVVVGIPLRYARRRRIRHTTTALKQ